MLTMVRTDSSVLPLQVLKDTCKNRSLQQCSCSMVNALESVSNMLQLAIDRLQPADLQLAACHSIAHSIARALESDVPGLREDSWGNDLIPQ